jgi:hypothetical protein
MDPPARPYGSDGNGACVLDSGAPPFERIAAEVAVDDAFLRCLEAKTAQGINVVPIRGHAYAPFVFETSQRPGASRERPSPAQWTAS